MRGVSVSVSPAEDPASWEMKSIHVVFDIVMQHEYSPLLFPSQFDSEGAGVEKSV